MDIAGMIAQVVVVTELIKKGLLKIKVEVKGGAAVVLAVLVSIGVVLVAAITTEAPLTLALVPVLIQVILASTIGYSIVTKAGSKK